jgi:hypothetical protein
MMLLGYVMQATDIGHANLCKTQKKQSDMLFVRGTSQGLCLCILLTVPGDSVVLISPQPA